jgi:hypothetical protein
MTLHQTHVYNFIDHAQWRSKNEKAARTDRVVSVERVEPFASKVSKRGKIVTIGSPKSFLKFRSSSVGLTATASLGGLLVVHISYVR